MSDTKEQILIAALRLFAKDGYEAVSVSDIAGAIGITKGALYKHYKNKRDIFDSIVQRMYQNDAENSRESGVPAENFADNPQSYCDISIENVAEFTLSQFNYWTKNEFAANFRRMLTLEQYRSEEMAKLYGNCIAEGPVAYMEDIFREMISRGILKESAPKLLAAEYYAPFFLLVSISDRNSDCEPLTELLRSCVNGFFKRNSTHIEKEKSE